MKKIFSFIFTLGFGVVLTPSAYAALVAPKIIAPVLKPAPVVVPVINPVTTKVVEKTTTVTPIIPIGTGETQMPPDPFDKTVTTQIPPDPFDKTITTQRPPDPLEKSATIEMPDDPLDKTSTVNMPVDPLERNNAGIQMPPDDFGVPVPLGKRNNTGTQMPPDDFGTPVPPTVSSEGSDNASLKLSENASRLVNEIMKGEQVKEPGKLENKNPRVLKMFSKEDLSKPEVVSSFVKEVKKAVPSIKEVDVKENIVTVSSERKAKFLGFISVKYRLTAEGNSDTGKVTVKKPWWLFFTKNDANKVEESLKDSHDTMSELAAIQQSKIDGKMERYSKAIETLSNIMTKISQTEEAITQNIK